MPDLDSFADFTKSSAIEVKLPGGKSALDKKKRDRKGSLKRKGVSSSEDEVMPSKTGTRSRKLPGAFAQVMPDDST